MLFPTSSLEPPTSCMRNLVSYCETALDPTKYQALWGKNNAWILLVLVVHRCGRGIIFGTTAGQFATVVLHMRRPCEWKVQYKGDRSLQIFVKQQAAVITNLESN